jgi:hypothetical protein
MSESSQEKRKWRCIGSVSEAEPFKIDGVDVWKHDWKAIPGVVADVKDPTYGRSFVFSVYEIQLAGRTVRFAAGEFSANWWGFYALV